MLAGIVVTLLVWLALVAAPALAEPTYPAFTGLVVDDAHVLSEPEKAALTRKLEALQATTNVQFAVATVSSLGGDEVEPYANALFRKWKIGQKTLDNGLLLILAPKERKLRFEVGYGLEGTFTDVQSKLILHNAMVPRLKANDPAGALKAGVDDAIAVLTKDKAGLPGADSAGGQAAATAGDAAPGGLATLLFLMIPLLIIVVVLVVLIQTLRGKIHWTSGPGGYTGGTTGGFSSNDSSSSSGGSFSGGGGGDSGGGGASDSY